MTSLSIRLVPISSVPNLTATQRAEILDTLFEKCTQLHTLSVSDLHLETFASYADLIRHVRDQLFQLYGSDLESDQKWLDAVLAAHPRLGEKKVDSAMSRMEQAGLKDNSNNNDDETTKLMELNRKYEETFPGLRYVVFVNARPRPVIMEDMQRRIDSSSLMQEKKDAIDAMCDIALDRVKKLGGS